MENQKNRKEFENGFERAYDSAFEGNTANCILKWPDDIGDGIDFDEFSSENDAFAAGEAAFDEYYDSHFICDSCHRQLPMDWLSPKNEAAECFDCYNIK